MVSRISSMITTMTDLHPYPQVWDDIDLLQGIVQTQMDYIDDFSSKVQLFI